MPEIDYEQRHNIIEKVYVLGDKSPERTAFAYLAAQYLAHSGRTIIVESDNDYHTLTEYHTKSGLDATTVSITEIYDDFERALVRIKDATTPLVVITCIDRIHFDYSFIINFLYYNLMDSFRYMLVESTFEEAPGAQAVTIVLPDTVIGCLKLGEKLERTLIPYAKFVAVNLNDLPETHLPSSKVISKILQDVFTDTTIQCVVVRVTSLRLNGTAYDLGSVLSHELVRGY